MSSKTYFDQIAGQWDSMQESFFSEAVRDKALRTAGVKAGCLAADIGAGSGFITAGLLDRGVQVIAVDQSEAMLAEMRRKFAGASGIEYRQGEAEALPIEAEAVDYAFANMYLHHVESPADAIKEMVRILKPGGRLVITDLDEHSHEFLAQEQHDRWLGFKRADVRAWFVAAGLKNVTVEDSEEQCCSTSCCGGEKAAISIFVASGEKEGVTAADSNIKQQVRERYGAIAAQHLSPVATAPIQLLDARPPVEASCCGPAGGCCSPGDAAQDATLVQALYQESDIAGLPDSVTLASLGCGNPTAIASLKPGETVLDLGSGGGIDCFIAARFVGPAGRVIGVDMTDHMLALAEQNRTKLGLTNVEFRKGEIEALPVESDTVDVIISNCVINLSPDKDAVFREAFRVLKPGGRFAVSDMVTAGEWPEQLKANVGAWAGCITGAIDQDIYLQKMRQAGFVEVAVESRSSYGLEDLDSLDETSRETLTKDVNWSTVPVDVRLYSAQIAARKPLV